jgi:hypothetical protein
LVVFALSVLYIVLRSGAMMSKSTAGNLTGRSDQSDESGVTDHSSKEIVDIASLKQYPDKYAADVVEMSSESMSQTTISGKSTSKLSQSSSDVAADTTLASPTTAQLIDDYQSSLKQNYHNRQNYHLTHSPSLIHFYLIHFL